MKRLSLLILCPAALFVAGCSSHETVYHAPLFGDPVGNIIVIEDKDHGVLIYKLVQGTGKSQMQVLVKDGSDWRLPEK